MELHLVHKAEDGDSLLILGVLFKIGNESKHIEKLLISARDQDDQVIDFGNSLTMPKAYVPAMIGLQPLHAQKEFDGWFPILILQYHYVRLVSTELWLERRLRIVRFKLWRIRR